MTQALFGRLAEVLLILPQDGGFSQATMAATRAHCL